MLKSYDDTKKLWAFTVRKNCKACERLDIKESDYNIFDDHVKSLGGVLIFRVFERDNKNRLHYHAILELPKKFYRKSLQLSGFHFKLCDIFSMEGWLEYMNKTISETLTTPTEIIENGFSDDDSIIIPNKSMFKRTVVIE